MSNFFSNQDRARRHTLLLTLLFLLAVISITFAADLVGYLVYRLQEPGHLSFLQWVQTSAGIKASLVCIGIIALGSLVRFAELRGGGEAVARMVGARELDPTSREPKERQLRNVVEEMSIASGVSVPKLYVIEQEPSINAFVAGYQPSKAVLVVTRGTLEHLSRDEMQGVIGHEFSHILNGDMRLNIRLIAILAGILVVGQIGLFLVRSVFYAGSASGSGMRFSLGNNQREDNGMPLWVLGLLGALLAAIGYIGVFFGRLIKAAISRQREMLADASSVQFTRNPEGIGGALYKIALHSHGSHLKNTRSAEEMNHMCFGDTVKINLNGLLATHPPIEKRLHAIDPTLLARMRARYGREQHVLDPTPVSGFTDTGQAGPAEGVLGAFADATAAGGATGTAPTSGGRLSQQVGTVMPHHQTYAQQLLGQLPSRFQGLIHTSRGVVQLCYALGLSEMNAPFREKALKQLPPSEDNLGRDDDALAYMEATIKNLGHAARLPLLEIATPTLRRLMDQDRSRLIGILKTIAQSNERISLFEFAMISYVVKHLDPNARASSKVRFRSYNAVQAPIQTLLWLVARAGAKTDAEAQKVFLNTAGSFFDNPQIPTGEKVSAQALQTALEHLSLLSPMLKPAILDACEDCAMADGVIKPREYELLRLVADQLDCPLPPLAARPG